MEIIIGVVASLLTELTKKLAVKLGEPLSRSLIYLVALMFCLLGGGLFWYFKNQIPAETLKEIGSSLMWSIGFYESVIKTIFGKAELEKENK